MPDDEKQEVTEQEETADEGFSGGFQDESQAKQPATEAKAVKEEKSEEEPEEKEEPEKKEAEAEAEAKEEETKEETTEEDEVEVRGKELLEAEKKAEEEAAKLKESAEKKKAETEERKAPPPPPPFNEELAKVYLDLANAKNLPQTVKLGEQELELREFVEANPEFTVLAGMEATNIIQRLVDQGILMTSDAHNQAMAKVLETVDSRLFDLGVRQHIPNPDQVWDSKEFQAYYKDAPDSFKALFRSKDPMDHVKGFRKYLGKATEKAKEKVKEVDAEASKKKKVHDDIHAHTMRGSKAKPTTDRFTDAEEEFSAGFRDNA